jgi:hypothetical protein
MRLVHLRLGAREVEQVLDAPDALDAARLLLEALDPLGLLHLASVASSGSGLGGSCRCLAFCTSP